MFSFLFRFCTLTFPFINSFQISIYRIFYKFPTFLDVLYFQSQRNSADQSLSEFNSSSMTHGSNQSVYHHNQHMDDSEMMMDEQDYSQVLKKILKPFQGHHNQFQYQMGFPEEDEMVEGMMTPRAVHQCNVCNKIFVSYKGNFLKNTVALSNSDFVFRSPAACSDTHRSEAFPM